MIKIETNFNFNILLKLFFSLSKKLIFFSPILANNNQPLKIYCEKIVIIFHYSFFPFFFFHSFFILHTAFLSSSFFFLFFFPTKFLLHTRTRSVFFFNPSFHLFFIPYLPFLQTPEHSPSSSLFFFFLSPFSLTLRLLVLGGIDMDWESKSESESESESESSGFDWEGFADLIEPRARCC